LFDFGIVVKIALENPKWVCRVVSISRLLTFLLFKVIVNLLQDKTKNEKNKTIEMKEIKEPKEDRTFNRKKKSL
jgi:hypothetical protein